MFRSQLLTDNLIKEKPVLKKKSEFEKSEMKSEFVNRSLKSRRRSAEFENSKKSKMKKEPWNCEKLRIELKMRNEMAKTREKSFLKSHSNLEKIKEEKDLGRRNQNGRLKRTIAQPRFW